jgi:hypothetical protein
MTTGGPPECKPDDWLTDLGTPATFFEWLAWSSVFASIILGSIVDFVFIFIVAVIVDDAHCHLLDVKDSCSIERQKRVRMIFETVTARKKS